MLLRKYGKSKEELARYEKTLQTRGDVTRFDACDVQVLQDKFTFQINHHICCIYEMPPTTRAEVVAKVNELIGKTRWNQVHQLSTLFKLPIEVKQRCFLDFLFREALEKVVGSTGVADIEAKHHALEEWMLMRGLA